MPIPKAKYIWMDGEYVPWEKAKIHVLSHGLHYGSGVFEGIRAYQTKKGTAVFRLKEHINRLYESAKIYKMNIPYAPDELVKTTKELINKNSLESCYIRPIAYRGYGEMGLNPLNSPVNVVIAAWPWGAYLGDEGIEKGISVQISTFRRIEPNTLPPVAKATGQYINSILAKMESLENGFDEAILLDSRGFVSEGSGENIFIVKDGVIITPPREASILVGITRDSVIKIAEHLDIKVVECNILRSDIYLSDEAFFSGTAAEIVPIKEVDRRVINSGKPGPVTKKLQDEFYKIVYGDSNSFKEWLYYV